jgi:hypothetical protein
MKKIFTLEESILQLPKSPNLIKSFIDSELKMVENINKGPDGFTVKKILDYAKALSVMKSERTGNINLILN